MGIVHVNACISHGSTRGCVPQTNSMYHFKAYARSPRTKFNAALTHLQIFGLEPGLACMYIVSFLRSTGPYLSYP